MDTGSTRRAWHAVAELLLAGPQYRRSASIELRVVPGGFATVAPPELSVDRTVLVVGGTRIPLDGARVADLAEAAGVTAGEPEGVYHEGSGAGVDEVLSVDPAAADVLADAFERGDAALRELAPDSTPVLWPEHFDVAITLDEINFGVSPGDGYLAEPYAYVGPWTPRQGEFWNAPFGAARPVAELSDIAEFFRTGRRLAGDS
jgi:hypothetical protein